MSVTSTQLVWGRRLFVPPSGGTILAPALVLRSIQVISPYRITSVECSDAHAWASAREVRSVGLAHIPAGACLSLAMVTPGERLPVSVINIFG